MSEIHFHNFIKNKSNKLLNNQENFSIKKSQIEQKNSLLKDLN
jgi:hypothetical protein